MSAPRKRRQLAPFCDGVAPGGVTCSAPAVRTLLYGPNTSAPFRALYCAACLRLAVEDCAAADVAAVVLAPLQLVP